MAVTRDGIPVRCWTLPGSESDQRIIRTVKDDLGAWQFYVCTPDDYVLLSRKCVWSPIVWKLQISER